MEYECFSSLFFWTFCINRSEWQSDGKMELEVTPKTRVQQRQVSGAATDGRIDGFHGAVEAEDEVAEIQAEAHSVGCGYLFPEAVQAELATGLFVVLAESPDVAGIDEEASVQLPEEVRSPLGAEVQLQVACLANKVYASIRPAEASRSEASDAPAANAVGTTREVTFFVGQNA